MLEKIRKDFGAITWMLVPVAIVINGAGGWIIRRLDLPLYMDTIGTILIAVAAGPWVGALTGVLTNMILGYVSPGYIPYWPASLGIGLVAGLCANAGMFKRWWKVVLAGFFIALTAATLSTLIAMRVHGNLTLDPSYLLIKEPVDKIASALIVFIFIKIIPAWIHSRLPRPENMGD